MGSGESGGSPPSGMWDVRYAEAELAYGDAPNDFLAAQAGRLPGSGRALALAEGQGRNAVWLATRGLEVTAVDQSAVGLARAEALAATRGVALHTLVADLAHHDLGTGCWDVIVSIWAHMPPAVRRPLHRAVVAALRPGGLFVLEAYTPAQVGRGTGGPPDPSLCMTLAGLREELAGLEVLHGVERERQVHEGRYHQGPSAVVKVLARAPGGVSDLTGPG